MAAGPSNRHSPVLVWILIFTIAGGAATGIYAIRISGKMPDLDVYLRAGARAAAAEPLYRAEDSHYQFKYLPAFALLMAPLSAVSLPVTRAVWFAGSLALLVLLLLMALRLVSSGAPPDLHKPAWLLTAATVVVLAKFYAHELVLGQVNIAFACVVTWALVALARGREATGGALLAIAIVLKPYGAIFLPWLVARGQRRSIVAVVLGLIATLVAPSAIYGWNQNLTLHAEWLGTLMSTTAPNLVNPDNVSWLAMFTRWTGGGSAPWPAALFISTSVFAIAIAAWMKGHRREVASPDGLEGALLLLAIPFLSPQGWDYVLLLATPAVMLVVCYEDRLPTALRGLTIAALATVGLTIYDLMGRTAYHAFMNASGITLCFVVVIAALVTLRARRIA